MSKIDDWNTAISNIWLPNLMATLTPFISQHPYWQVAVISAIWLYWVFLQHQQDRLNEFIKFIQDNPWEFTKKIVETQEFKDWFLLIFEAHIKERNEEKRNIIKNIFLWFTKLSKEEKKKFELEKILNTLKTIAKDEIKLISLYNFKKINTNKKDVLDLFNYFKIEWWNNSQIWLIMKEHYNIKTYFDDRFYLLEIIKWCENLNLIIKGDSTRMKWGTGNYHLTKFWENLIKFITK